MHYNSTVMKHSTIKYLTFLILVTTINCSAWAQTPADEKDIRAVVQNMEDAWNAHDYSYSGKNDMYDNAVLINPVGMYWKNKTEIIKGIQTFGNTRLKYETIKYNKVDVRFLAPTVSLATIQSTETVTQDYNNPDGTKARSKGDAVESISSFTLVKKSDAWKIYSEQVTIVDQNAAPYNPVK